MKNKFSLEGFKNGDFMVNCRLEKDAGIFLAYLHDQGLKWYEGVSLLPKEQTVFEKLLGFDSSTGSRWEWYEENTCYGYMNGGVVYDTPRKGVEIYTYSNMVF